MHFLDYFVLVIYFVVLIAIGVVSSKHINRQEDFFLGGRSFGKLLQTFAAFGAGTGSSAPVNAARTTFTGGVSGMWSVMYWLFVTPFYWITGVWYRRMRHLTLGDWFVERYESRALGAAYAVFGLIYYMIYGSMLFTAVGKVAAPIIQIETVEIFGNVVPLEQIMVPLIGMVVLIYGIAGGLEAAYLTDLVQGLCIILLSVILIPFGLAAINQQFAPDSPAGWTNGFRIIHEQLPETYFNLIGSSNSEFPLHRIIAVVLLNLIGIVVLPHFIATGGGSAKTELSARVGVVTGNFLKRFCTIGWVLTALIALTLFADHPDLIEDPDKTWGIASRELLGPGLTGLMLACLLAALMSSIDAYMIVSSALVSRNLYAAFLRTSASDKEYLTVGRVSGILMIAGAVIISLSYMDVFKQLQITWVVPILFAAPFWLGMYWRGATTAATWCTIVFVLVAFFVVPFGLPRTYPEMHLQPDLSLMNRWVRSTTSRPAAPADLRRGAAEGKTLQLGELIPTSSTTGGASIFWQEGLRPVDETGNPIDVQPIVVKELPAISDSIKRELLAYPPGTILQGQGNFKLEAYLYRLVGMPLASMSDATLATLELPSKIVVPFLVMFFASLVTPKNTKENLDRYYAKMKTPVSPDPEIEAAQLHLAYTNPGWVEQQKLFPDSSLEFNKPTLLDIGGFVLSFAACFGIIWLMKWVAGIGG